MQDKSKERALEILNVYLNKVCSFNYIKSIILVGSLSDNTYTGNSGSDIDLVHIIKNDASINYAREEIVNLINQIHHDTNYDIPISKTIYQYQDLFHPYRDDFSLSSENKDYVELPVEILRMKDTGKVIYGDDIISSIEHPTIEDMIKRNQLSKEMTNNEAKENPEWYKSYIEMYYHPTSNILTQIVITNALEDYFMMTGKNCSSKYRILHVIEEELPSYPYLQLLRLCHKWRFNQALITNDDLKKMNILYEEWKLAHN